MRVILSMLGANRSDISSPPADSPQPKRLFGSLSRNRGITASVGSSEPFQSSASSSSGSQPRTLKVNEGHLRRSISKPTWMPWIGGGKKATDGSKKSKIEEYCPVPLHEAWPAPLRKVWHSPSAPSLRQPSRSRALLPNDSEDESTSSESEEESDIVSVPDHRSTTTIATAHNNLRSMIEDSLQPPFSPPPLLHVQGQPLYPRSSNSRRSLYKHDSMETSMHKARLLHRLSRQDLTRPEDLSIVSLGVLNILPVKRPSLVLDDQAVPRTHHVRKFSQGLQAWALRSCFEDRMDVWMPEGHTAPQTILRKRVTGTDLGVAALEISEFTDLLAGAAVIDNSDIPNHDQAPLPRSSAVNPTPLPTSSHPGQNVPSLPSPLRIEHRSSPSLDLTLPLVTEEKPAAVPVVKRGVRFAEDDKDDQIPLGYVLRIKKRKEERVRFLQEERERRVYEEDRAQQEAERLRREAERQEWEREKKAWEKEKRAMEDERRRRQYAEEVAAARLRRDAARTGFYVSSTGSSALRDPARPTLATRDALPLPPRRQAFDSAAGAHVSGSSPHSRSPSSSNPPSVHEASPTGSGFFARPSSTSSANTTLSSAEDMQVRKNNTSKRYSVASTTSAAQQLQSQVISTAPQVYPVWANPYTMPVYPGMPMYGVDSPLLPPTPPFMMHQNSSRSGSHNSSAKSRSSSRNQSASNNNSSPASSSSRNSMPRMQHHHRGSSNDALPSAQRPTVTDRRPGRAIDNWRSSTLTPPSTYRTPPHLSQTHSTPQPLSPQGQWSLSSRGRNTCRRQSVRTNIN